MCSDKLEESDAGTLNFSFCQSSGKESSENVALLHDVSMYRDMAEYENRRLKVKASGSIEAVGQFWRNIVLEERTRAGKMVMTSLRKHLKY